MGGAGTGWLVAGEGNRSRVQGVEGWPNSRGDRCQEGRHRHREGDTQQGVSYQAELWDGQWANREGKVQGSVPSPPGAAFFTIVGGVG